MVEVYADLVELGLRALEPNEQGIKLVPSILREQVRIELERRKGGQ